MFLRNGLLVLYCWLCIAMAVAGPPPGSACGTGLFGATLFLALLTAAAIGSIAFDVHRIRRKSLSWRKQSVSLTLAVAGVIVFPIAAYRSFEPPHDPLVQQTRREPVR